MECESVLHLKLQKILKVATYYHTPPSPAGYDKILAKEVNEAQLLLVKLKRLEFLKRQVMELKQQTIAELKSYSKPPPVVKFVSFGADVCTLPSKHARNLE